MVWLNSAPTANISPILLLIFTQCDKVWNFVYIFDHTSLALPDCALTLILLGSALWASLSTPRTTSGTIGLKWQCSANCHLFLYSFVLAASYDATGHSVCLSVCPSVRPSRQTRDPRLMHGSNNIIIQHDRAMFLVSWRQSS